MIDFNEEGSKRIVRHSDIRPLHDTWVGPKRYKAKAIHSRLISREKKRGQESSFFSAAALSSVTRTAADAALCFSVSSVSPVTDISLLDSSLTATLA